MTLCAPSDLEFDEAKHRFGLRGKRLPGVTQVLRSEGFIDDRWWNDGARERGSAIHAAIHYLEEDDLDWETVPPGIHPFIYAYQFFKAETGFKPLLHEVRLASEEMGFAGILDVYGLLEGVPVLPDFKSGTGGYNPKWHDLQFAAYHALLLANRDNLTPKLTIMDMPRKHFVLQLKANGDYQLHYIKSEIKTALATFNAALTTFNWKMTRRIKHVNGSGNGAH